MNGIEKAIKFAGGMKPLAKAVGVSYEAVRQWKHLGFVPQSSTFDVEDFTGVSCFELNPNVYPIERFKQAS